MRFAILHVLVLIYRISIAKAGTEEDLSGDIGYDKPSRARNVVQAELLQSFHLVAFSARTSVKVMRWAASNPPVSLSESSLPSLSPTADNFPYPAPVDVSYDHLSSRIAEQMSSVMTVFVLEQIGCS